jgi:hypothetical protein
MNNTKQQCKANKRIILFRKEAGMQILKFKRDDWKHVWWLFKNMIYQLSIGDFKESKEAWYWIKIHCTYPSNKLN